MDMAVVTNVLIYSHITMVAIEDGQSTYPHDRRYVRCQRHPEESHDIPLSGLHLGDQLDQRTATHTRQTF